jgi:site-specific recombinase XerD
MSRGSINLWVAEFLDTGSAAATARSRQLAVRRFSAWLSEEGEVGADPFLGVKAPKLDERVIEPLADAELKAFIRACQPPRGAEPKMVPKMVLRHWRDEAIIRLMLETGMRAGETVALGVGDIDLLEGTATVRRGTGGKGRSVPFGSNAALSLEPSATQARSPSRYEPRLWLGDGSRCSCPVRDEGVERVVSETPLLAVPCFPSRMP